MMPIKSTLAVSAIILGGLVAASPFPYPRESEARPERVAHAVAPDLEEPAATATWVDPPKLAATRSENPAAAVTVAAAPAAPDVQKPVAAANPVVPAPDSATKPADQAAARLAAKRAEQAKRRRLAQAARSREAALKQGAASQQAAADRQVAAAAAPAAPPFDPLTSLFRGLGFGRQG